MFVGEIERSFAFYSSLLAFKTLALTGITIIRRFKYGAFCKSAQNSEVEAVRRCHLNDIENLLPFMILGTMYCKTNPSLLWAIWHFRIFTLARILHSPAYLYTEGKFPRGPIAMVAIIVNVSLALQCIAYYW
ncbi:hypothetical protein AHF37_02781 [Paragonimus kellicotti]|nr:hypothetical protein AHF37_02781 [Paragonimus kellicotti]